MEINIKEMSIILKELGKLVDEYELNHYSYYNEINTSSTVWNSTNNEMLINEVDNQKIQINGFISFLKNYILIYYRLVNELSYLGDNIKFYLEKKDKIIEIIDIIITLYDEIVEIYESITYVDESISNQKKETEDMLKIIMELKEFINELYEKINDMNIFMKSKIDNLDNVIIKEEEII